MWPLVLKGSQAKRVKVIFGSSGDFFQQIENGAPFDMFFPRILITPQSWRPSGRSNTAATASTPEGRSWSGSPNDSKINLNSGLRVLIDPTVKKIAIANPLHAPYGQAAVSAMQKEGIYDKAKDKFVLGENISQTASFVVSGSADIGVVALSLALSPNMKDKGRYK
jgi:molybdate transport system substrate-binding protein